jgi:peptidoglycan/xylan/chitin deacetylase (PgdA/CDA1 family)
VDLEGAGTAPRRLLSRSPAPVRFAVAAAELARLRATRRRVGLALVYHRVAERAGDPAHELNPAVAADAFARQMSFVARTFLPVLASALPSIVAARRRGDPIPLAVTFDDDLPEHARVAAPLLRRHRIPATFFLCGSFLGGERRFWWDDLQAAVDAGTLRADDLPGAAEALARRPRAIHAVAKAIEELAPDERAAVARVLAERAAPHRPAQRLTAEDARALASSHEIGFHTRRHDRLVGLDEAALAERVSDGRAGLEALAGGSVTAIAYPHGKADARVAAVARDAGFAAGYTGVHAAFADGDDELLIGRVEPRAGQGLGRFAWTIARVLRAAG